MATPVGRIEKEFFLNALYTEKLSITYVKDRTEYILRLERPAGEELVFRCDRPMSKLKPNIKMPLLFDYRGQAVDFTVELLSQKDDLLFCKAPDVFYKNLDRSYLRVDIPSDLKILFTYQGDRYNLAFPKINEYENIVSEDLIHNMNPGNLSGLIKQITTSLSKFADGYKIVNFKDKKPEIMEERIISETGKTLFIPSTAEFFPKTDPYPKKRIVTEELFKRYLESTGVGKTFLDENCMRFLKHKHNEGIYSDAWIPILFHEYVIGYIHVWTEKKERPPIDYSMLDNVYQYAKVLAFALKENGYFEHGKVQNVPFECRVLDISASGLLFACSLGSTLLSTLFVDAELNIAIETPNRTVNVVAKIVRRFKDKSAGYFGCQFTEIAQEDMRFLFEYLYGKHFDKKDSAFLSGQA